MGTSDFVSSMAAMTLNVCKSAIATRNYDSAKDGVCPITNAILKFKRGDTFLISKEAKGWVYGSAGVKSGWVPEDCVHIFPQHEVDRSDSPSLESDLPSLSLGSRKPSDGSQSTTTDLNEPLEMQGELLEEVSSYTMVDTATHKAMWVPYYHEGSVVYLDTRSKIISRYLPFLPLEDDEEELDAVIPAPLDIPSQPLALFENELQSLSSVAKAQPCLYKNSDFYRMLRHVKRPEEMDLNTLWTQLCKDSPNVSYPTWPELMDGFMVAIDDCRRVQDLVPQNDEDKATVKEAVLKVITHLKAICWAAQVPPGTAPSLGLGAISAAYRLMLHSVFEIHVNYLRGLRIGSPDDLTHSTIDFVALFHVVTGYPTIEVVPMPRIVQVAMLNSDWADYHFEVDATNNHLTLFKGPNEPLNTSQAMALEAAVPQVGICHMVCQDVQEKSDQLETAVNNCINLWNEICQDTLQHGDGLQESSVSLFSSLHAVMAIYKSCVLTIDCVDLCQFADSERPRLEDLSVMLRVRKTVYKTLLTMEHSWVRPQRSLCLTDEYASAVKIVPLLYNVIDQFPKLLNGIVPTVKIMRWDPDTEDMDEAIFDSVGHLRGATKEKLVEHLTQHVQPRPHEVSAFLTTFPAFMKHIELVDMLQDRFSIQPATGLSRRDFRDWEVHVQRPTRLRVVNMLRMWIETYWSHPDTEEEEAQLFTRLELLLKILEVQEFPGSQRLHEMLMRRRASSGDPFIRKSSSTQPLLDPILPACPVSELTSPTQLSPVELARQLTLLGWSYYMDITAEDCLRRALERPSRSTAISEFVNYWNQSTCWVSQEVLNAETPADRALRITYFVETAQHCRDIKNFSTMMSILSALSSAGIHRLRQTWALVSPATKRALEDMNRLMNSSRNFQEYRDILSLVSEPALPFFGVCLMDLRFAQDGNSDHIRGDERLINFAKWTMVANIIESTLRFQRMVYRLTPIPRVADLINERFQNVPSLNDQYPLSLEREARTSKTRPHMLTRVSSHTA